MEPKKFNSASSWLLPDDKALRPDVPSYVQVIYHHSWAESLILTHGLPSSFSAVIVFPSWMLTAQVSPWANVHDDWPVLQIASPAQ